MSVAPLRPEDVPAARKAVLPDVVITVWNRLIAENWRGSFSVVRQDAAVSALAASAGSEQAVFDRDWLEIEDIYRSEGWDVVYDKPAYNESYPATFKFTPKQRG
jgi:hypothetical protein